MSWLAGLILNLLSTQGRPLEAATLKGLLRNPTTSAKAEYFLRYTVVRDLVAQLQSPNPATVLRDVHPFLVESSTHFIHMVEKQFPVSRECYSCPTFLWWWSHCHIVYMCELRTIFITFVFTRRAWEIYARQFCRCLACALVSLMCNCICG